jgi:4'-phosphopantetheinyl transferase
VTPLTVSVWTVDLDQPRAVVDSLRAFLLDDEVRAAAARTNDVVRNRYVVAHGALRSVLGHRLDIAPGAVEISRKCARCGDATHGKPAVVQSVEVPGSIGLEFSLSHSHSFGVIAVASGARVGVDIEVERPRARLDALAERVLGPGEYSEWLDMPPTARLRAFLRYWTAKEAYLKAIGAGITMSLRDVPPEPEGWTVTGFPSPPETIARLAVEAYAVVQVEEWTPPIEVSRTSAADGARPIDKFRNTAVGSVFAAGLMGLRDVLEPERDDKVAIVQDYKGDPPFKDPIVLRLDPDHPEDSIVMVRPWLRDPPANRSDEQRGKD